jgi:uncharacterized membrane protein
MHRLLVTTLALFVGQQPAGEGQPPLLVIRPKPIGVEAVAINSRGDVIGFEWVEEKEAPGVLSQLPILARGTTIHPMPLMEGYTATFPSDVSDEGLVVGWVSRPPRMRRPGPQSQGVVWEVGTDLKPLGTLEGDLASMATGVTADGKTITGYSLGRASRRPCSWERTPEGYRISVLPHQEPLGSNVVVISPSGTHAAAVDGSRLCLWTREADGGWAQEVIGEPGALVPRAVNDDGTVVGLRHDRDGHTHATFWTRETGVRTIPKPAPFVRSEAYAINRSGLVVGMIDGPRGSEIGPTGFVYDTKTHALRLITEGGASFTTATAINDAGQVSGVFEEDEDDDDARANEP